MAFRNFRSASRDLKLALAATMLAASGLFFAMPFLLGVLWEQRIQRVTDSVYALVGEMVQRSPQNLANNATFGVVVTEDGVLLIDPGVVDSQNIAVYFQYQLHQT